MTDKNTIIVDKTINKSIYKNSNLGADGIRERMIERQKLTMKYIKSGCSDEKTAARLKSMGVIH